MDSLDIQGVKFIYGLCLLILSCCICVCRALSEDEDGTNRAASVGPSVPEGERTIIVIHAAPPEVPQEAYQQQPAFNDQETPPPSYSEATQR